MISIVPIESVAASIPLGELIKPLLPSGSSLTFYVVPLRYILSGPAGPATLHVVRYLHKTKAELVETGKTIAILQGFCYLSWIVFCLSSAQRNSWLDHDFWGGFFLFVLPGAFVGLALMRWRGGEPGVDIRA